MLMRCHTDIVSCPQKISSQALIALMVKQRTMLILFHTCVVIVLRFTAAFWPTHITLWEFFTHFFGLILQSFLKPVCFDHLIGNFAFILIALQFKRRLRQAVT